MRKTKRILDFPSLTKDLGSPIGAEAIKKRRACSHFDAGDSVFLRSNGTNMQRHQIIRRIHFLGLYKI